LVQREEYDLSGLFTESHIKLMETNENHPPGKRASVLQLKIKPNSNSLLYKERENETYRFWLKGSDERRRRNLWLNLELPL